MKDILVAVTAVGLVGFAQAGEPSFYKYCEDLIESTNGPELSRDYRDHADYLVQDCEDYHVYGARRGWLPESVVESARLVAAGTDPDAPLALPHPRMLDMNGRYYGYRYCENLIGRPDTAKDADYAYDRIDDCLHYLQYGLRNGWMPLMFAMGGPTPPPEPGKPGQDGKGGDGGSIGGLKGGAGGASGGGASGHEDAARTRGYGGMDGRDGASYGSGEGGMGGRAGHGVGGGDGGAGGAASTGGVGGAGGKGGTALD